ncbi:hypothetical protein ACFWZ3_08700 [Frateuria sp. GZRR35]|uniref:hypothetical protein n=1 Tax=Frateuria sp. GZRR35 TaxID=3351536 RepID=UPI003EDBF14B
MFLQLGKNGAKLVAPNFKHLPEVSDTDHPAWGKGHQGGPGADSPEAKLEHLESLWPLPDISVVDNGEAGRVTIVVLKLNDLVILLAY